MEPQNRHVFLRKVACEDHLSDHPFLVEVKNDLSTRRFLLGLLVLEIIRLWLISWPFNVACAGIPIRRKIPSQ